jgi:integrase
MKSQQPVTLTDKNIKSAKRDLRDALVPGLVLRVMPSGVRSFVLVGRFGGKDSNPTRRSLGVYGAITLADARKTAREWIALVQVGKDPADEVKRKRDEEARKRADTVAAAVDDYLARGIIGLRSADRIRHNFEDILTPMFGHRPIAELTPQEVSRALVQIEKHGTDHGLVKLGVREELRRPKHKAKPALVQARNLFCYLDGMLRWAAETGDYGINQSPLMRVNKRKRFGPAPRRKHYVKTEEEIGAIWNAVGALPSPHRQFYRMLMLTGLRKDEVREAKWSEFDSKLTEWTIAAERMKGRKETAEEHTVPLTAHMRDELKTLTRGARGPFVFSCNGGESAFARSNKAKAKLDAAVAEQVADHFTNHDLRRTLRTWSRKLGVGVDVGEAILAHAIPGTAGIYDQYDRLDERRTAHVMWGEFLVECGRKASKIVRMRKAA